MRFTGNRTGNTKHLGASHNTILFVMNMFIGMNGIVWTQLTADIINVVISYVIYACLIGDIASQGRNVTYRRAGFLP